MKHLILIVAVLFSTNSYALIGYGFNDYKTRGYKHMQTGTSFGMTTVAYRKGNYVVMAFFHKGKTVAIGYTDGTGKAAGLSPAECQKFCKLNGSGWKHNGGDMSKFSYTGKSRTGVNTTAEYDKANMALLIATDTFFTLRDTWQKNVIDREGF